MLASNASANCSPTSAESPLSASEHSSTTMIFLSIFLTFINIVIIFGNCMVIAAAKTSRKLRNNVTILFIISLAMSDLLLGTFVLPFSSVNQLLSKRWIFGDVICYIWLGVDVWLFTASILNLVVISFDRFLAIRLPTKYPDLMTKRRARLLVICVWTLAFIICFPTIVQILKPRPTPTRPLTDLNRTFSNGTSSLERSNCAPENLPRTCSIATSSPTYIISSAMGSFFIPLCIICYFYLRIYLIIRTHIAGIRTGQLKSNIQRNHTITMRVHYGGANQDNASLRASTKSTNNNRSGAPSIMRLAEESNTDTSATDRDVLVARSNLQLPRTNSYRGLSGSRSTLHRSCSIRLASNSEKRVSRLRRETKAARTLGIVCGVFIFCLLPFFSVYISGAFCVNCVSDLMFDICFWLGYCNSALNPAIYALFSREFRLAFLRLLRCRCRPTEPSSRSTTYVL